AKEEAYGALVEGSAADRLVLAGIVAGSVLTVTYSLRVAVGLLRPDAVVGRAGDRAATAGGPARWLVAPAGVWAGFSGVRGVRPGLWSGLVDHAARARDPASGAHLALWHGVSPALVLSLATLAAGAALFAGRRRLATAQARLAPPVDSAGVYD